MKTNIRIKEILGLFILFALQVLWSCEDHTISPETSNEYFLLSDHAKVSYLKEFIFQGDETEIWNTDTVTFTVLGDTLIEGITYKKIMNEHGSLEKVVRKTGVQHFGRNHELYGGFSKEYMFLDTNVPVNGSWEYIKDEGNAKTEYVVKATDVSQIINGVEYKDVIKLEVNYYNNYADGVNLQLLFTTAHYYAKGVGEIYAYYPVIASGMFNDLKFSLIPTVQK